MRNTRMRSREAVGDSHWRSDCMQSEKDEMGWVTSPNRSMFFLSLSLNSFKFNHFNCLVARQIIAVNFPMNLIN